MCQPQTIASAGFRVRIAGTGAEFLCAANSSLLEASALLGALGLRSGCRSGGCGICRVRIESGEVRTGRMSQAHVDDVDRARGLVLACKAFPLSDPTLTPAGRDEAKA